MEQNIIKSGEWGTCLWGIDDTGFLVIGEGTGESLTIAQDAPWDENREQITAVTVAEGVKMPHGSSLREMFKDCINLVDAKLDGLDTSEVVDMSSMFENCSSLRELELARFDTAKTEDFGKMFFGCKNLTNLDLSSFNTTNARNMRKMFGSCKKLQGMVLGEKFDINGNGRTECGNLSIRETGKYRFAKVVNVLGGKITYFENRGRRNRIEKTTLSDFKYTIEDNPFEDAGGNYKFYGWCETPEGKGNVYVPGQEIGPVEDDLNLYALWICPPRVGELEAPAEFVYGNPIPFVKPEVASGNDDTLYGYLELSPDGEEGSWKHIEPDVILPVACNGYLLRMVATNRSGSAITNPVKLRIKKAGVDLSKVHWEDSGDMIYDGSPKQVWLAGLPEGVTARYEGNYASEAGDYVCRTEFDYDTNNYDIPVRIKDYAWTVKKSHYDMSQARWDYAGAFIYDGTEKSVTLEGLPVGVEAVYTNNSATNAGVMTASVELKYDSRNYEAPSKIAPCVWEIKRKPISIKDLRWTECGNFVYDGSEKRVELANLPADAVVEYSGNAETLAGKYLARATVVGNYYTNSTVEYEWQIKKSKYNMSDVHWDYTEPFTYDQNSHEVRLVGVPAGLDVRYQNYVATDSGDYVARASFECRDSHNFATPDDKTVLWSIKKATADMSNVSWTYKEPFTYDGEAKTVTVTGLPSNVYAVIENGSARNAGVYVAHAVLKYDEKNLEVEQPADCQWQINKAVIDMSAVNWDYAEPFKYDGEPKTVALMNLPDGLNVEYSNNTKLDAGRYVATARLIPSDQVNYEIPVVNGCAWSIRKSVLEKGDIVWSDDSEFEFDGNPKTVTITSDVSDKINVEYSGNVETNAGVHEAIATFYPTDTVNYEAPKAVHHTWHIKKSSYKMSGVVWDYSEAFTYDGQKKTVKLLNVPEGLIVHYENNTGVVAGDYVATATFEVMDSDNYYPVEPVSLKWTIGKANYDMSAAAWQEVREFSYDGLEKRVEIKGLPDGVTPIYSNNTANVAGEYTASVTFKYDEINYEYVEFPECRWKINRSVFDTEHARWSYDQAFVYDGSEKIVRVVDLPEGAEIKYENASATKAGIYYATADVIAEDSRNFTNTSMENLAWRIEKGEYDMSQVRWDYDKPLLYDGQEKKIVLKGLPEGVMAVYSGNQGVESGGYTANVSFKIADYDNYNVPTFPSCDWEIAKADIDMSGVRWNYSNEITYNGRMHEILLSDVPKGLRVVYSGNFGTNVGGYVASAEFIPFDTGNYNIPEIDDCKWSIVKADYDMTSVKWDYDNTKIYNGREQGVYLENLPNGVYASYTNNEAVETGKYTASAALTVSDAANYNVPAVPTCDWQIIPADYDMSAVKWNFVPGTFVYDKKEKTVELTNIPEIMQVTYSGNQGMGAGDYTAVATFKVNSENYNTPDAMVCDWFIDKAECKMNSVRWNYTDEFTYNAEKQGVELKGLPDNVQVEYINNEAVEAGTYEAVARFTTDAANYVVPEPMACTWTIGKDVFDISGIRWDYDEALVYDGTEKVITLAGVSDQLKVEYSGNTAVNAGTYSAEARFLPVDSRNFRASDPMELTWEIVKNDYDLSNAYWSEDKVFVYDGSEKSICLTGYPEAIEPIYTSERAVTAGTYNATVEFSYDRENYNEPVVDGCKWVIRKNTYDMSKAYWDYEGAYVYDGAEKSVVLRGLPEGVTPVYTNNTKTDAGEYYATVVFRYDEQNYEKPVMEGCKWRIDLADIPVNTEELAWTYKEPFVYDGTPKSIGFVTEMIEPEVLEEEEQIGFMGRLFGGRKTVETVAEPIFRLIGIPEGFDVVYENNEQIEVGTYFAKATIKHGSNPNYKTKAVPECKWEIRKAKIDMSQVRWDYDHAFDYDGEVKEVRLIDVPEQIKVSYNNNSAFKAGSYEATASFELLDDKNYEMPKPVRGCWWKINKAVYDMSGVKWTYSDDVVYDGKEKTIKVIDLPEGVKVESYTGNKATDAGSYTATVKFKFKNADNYEVPEIPPLRWKIQKRKINTDSIEWNYNDSTLFVYDEQVKDVRLIGIPKDIDVSYVNNSKINAGTYVAKAKLTYDTKNYIADEIPDCVWTIEKATFDTSRVCWNYDGPFEYDGTQKKIVLNYLPNQIDVRYMDNRASEVGSYTAKAYLSYNTDNYNTPEIDTTIEWEIVRG